MVHKKRLTSEKAEERDRVLASSAIIVYTRFIIPAHSLLNSFKLFWPFLLKKFEKIQKTPTAEGCIELKTTMFAEKSTICRAKGEF